LRGGCVSGSVFKDGVNCKMETKMKKEKNGFIPIESNTLKKIELNKLKEIRVGQGLTITALSKSADVSTKVISQTERMLIDPTLVTKNKIVKGLNALRSTHEKLLAYKDVFPDF